MLKKLERSLGKSLPQLPKIIITYKTLTSQWWNLVQATRIECSELTRRYETNHTLPTWEDAARRKEKDPGSMSPDASAAAAVLPSAKPVTAWLGTTSALMACLFPPAAFPAGCLEGRSTHSRRPTTLSQKNWHISGVKNNTKIPNSLWPHEDITSYSLQAYTHHCPTNLSSAFGKTDGTSRFLNYSPSSGSFFPKKNTPKGGKHLGEMTDTFLTWTK